MELADAEREAGGRCRFPHGLWKALRSWLGGGGGEAEFDDEGAGFGADVFEEEFGGAHFEVVVGDGVDGFFLEVGSEDFGTVFGDLFAVLFGNVGDLECFDPGVGQVKRGCVRDVFKAAGDEGGAFVFLAAEFEGSDGIEANSDAVFFGIDFDDGVFVIDFEEGEIGFGEGEMLVDLFLQLLLGDGEADGFILEAVKSDSNPGDDQEGDKDKKVFHKYEIDASRATGRRGATFLEFGTGTGSACVEGCHRLELSRGARLSSGYCSFAAGIGGGV